MTSWVIRRKADQMVICETFNRRFVDAINTEKYEAIPIKEYLEEFNRKARETVPERWREK